MINHMNERIETYYCPIDYATHEYGLTLRFSVRTMSYLLQYTAF